MQSAVAEHTFRTIRLRHGNATSKQSIDNPIQSGARKGIKNNINKVAPIFLVHPSD